MIQTGLHDIYKKPVFTGDTVLINDLQFIVNHGLYEAEKERYHLGFFLQDPKDKKLQINLCDFLLKDDMKTLRVEKIIFDNQGY